MIEHFLQSYCIFYIPSKCLYGDRKIKIWFENKIKQNLTEKIKYLFYCTYPLFDIKFIWRILYIQ